MTYYAPGTEELDHKKQNMALQQLAGGLSKADAIAVTTRAIAVATIIPPTVDYFRTAGYYAAGDGGGALYARVAAVPSHLGYIQSADGAYWEIHDRIVPEMLGAKGDGSTNDYTAFVNAQAVVRAQSYNGAGVLYLNSKHYKLGTAFALESDITLQGTGQEGSVLDFSGAGGHGLTATSKVCIKIRDLMVINAALHAIKFDTCAYIDVRNVFTETSGSSGMQILNTFMASFSDIRCHNNGAVGIRVDGFSTSLDFYKCYADTMTTGDGWRIYNSVYCSLTACGSDAAADYGYHFQNVSGVTLNGCGSESNSKGNILIEASTAIAVGATVPDIAGLVFNGCFSTANGGGAGFYSSFAEIASTNSKPIDVTFNGCSENTSVNGISLLMSGAGVAVTKIGGTLLGSTTPTSSALFYDLLGAWTSYTPTVAAIVGAFTTLGTVVARYKLIGKVLSLQGAVPITTIGTAATRMTVTLPTGFTGAYVVHAMSANKSTAGNFTSVGAMTGYDSGTTISIPLAGAASGDTYYFAGQVAVI